MEKKFYIFLFFVIALLLPNRGFAYPVSNSNADFSFVYPVVNPRLSSNFGLRQHPVLKASRHHNGVDLAAPKGAPVRAVFKGRVVFADAYAGYGNLVVIMHDSNFSTHYGHLDKINVVPGEVVSAGQIIATVGSTGISTGPHLHFEIRRNGKVVNPTRYVPGLLSEAKG